MSPWKLVYCFTKKLAVNDKQFKGSLYSLKVSIELSSKYHQVKILTDNETLSYLDDIDVNKEIINFNYFRFIDDIKIQVIKNLEDNEILIDPDIFLYQELLVDDKCDVFLERPEKITDSWYITDKKDAKKFKFYKLLKFKSKTGDVGNIGIIKFFNKELLEKYINEYNYIRDVALTESDKLEPFPKYSMLLGQLLLQNIIDKNNYLVRYAKFVDKNRYSHLAGEQKFKKGFIDKLTKPKSLM